MGWEFASLVHVDLPQWFHNGSKAGMGLVAIGHWIGVVVCKLLSLIVFGGALILVALVQVPLVHGHGDGWEVPELGKCEAGKFGNMLALQSLG